MPSQAKVSPGSDFPSNPLGGFSVPWNGFWGDPLPRASHCLVHWVNTHTQLSTVLAALPCGVLHAGRARGSRSSSAPLHELRTSAQKESEPSVCFNEIPSNTSLLNFFFFFFSLRGWFIMANFLLRMKLRIMFLVLIHKEDLHFIHTIKVLLMETSR